VYPVFTGIPPPAALAGQAIFRASPWVLQGAFTGGFVILPLGWIASVVRAGVPRLRPGCIKI
jgi:hypothetical protein